MIDKITNYINKSPRIKYFEFQVIFYSISIYNIITLFCIFILIVDLLINFYSYTFFKIFFNLTSLLSSCCMLYYQIRIIFLLQVVQYKIKLKAQKFWVKYLILSLFFTLFFLLINYLFPESNQSNKKLVWNTIKIDFYFILGYLYIKYSKRAHDYFNFYEKDSIEK
jgi:hypothetical protein